MLTDKEIEKIHSVINEEYPCGISIKSDKSEYRKLRNLYNVCQTSLRMLTEVNEEEDLDEYNDQNIENWSKFSEELINTFSTRSKDIELISWFIIAQIIIDNSFYNLNEAFKWLYKLIDESWDDLPPLVSEDKLNTESKEDVEKAAAKCKTDALSPMLGDSLESTMLFPPLLIHDINSEIKVFDYISAKKKFTLGSLEESADKQSIDNDYVLNKIRNLSNIIKLLENLAEKVNEKTMSCNVSQCNFNFLINLFNEVKQSITFITGVGLSDLEEVVDTENSSGNIVKNEFSISGDQKSRSEQLSGNNAIDNNFETSSVDKNYLDNAYKSNCNRKVALQNLKEISDFFYITEPHSPISFLMKKAIRWANLPLSSLLDELMGRFDKDLLNHVYQATGIEGKELNPAILSKVAFSNKKIKDDNVQVNESLGIAESPKHVSTASSNEKDIVEKKTTQSSKQVDGSVEIKSVKW